MAKKLNAASNAIVPVNPADVSIEPEAITLPPDNHPLFGKLAGFVSGANQAGIYGQHVDSKASREFARRPYDQRYTSMDSLFEFTNERKVNSAFGVANLGNMHCEMTENAQTGRDLVLAIEDHAFRASNWGWIQLLGAIGCWKDVGEKVDAEHSRDIINYFLRENSKLDLGLLIDEQNNEIRSVTSEGYGRIWDADIVDFARHEFADWHVPGIFGVKQEEITKEHTTLYASDRDMFMFLCDEENRIEIPNRRNGESGSMAIGVYLGNSEVGDGTLFGQGFLFDYMCMNHNVWGFESLGSIAIRHSKTAAKRAVTEFMPSMIEYSKALDSVKLGVVARITDAQSHKLDGVEDILKLYRTLDPIVGKKMVPLIMATHEQVEGRPIENRWDAVNALTAFARTVPYADKRTAIQTAAGTLMKA